jgi:hypothetical protein
MVQHIVIVLFHYYVNSFEIVLNLNRFVHIQQQFVS